ncbi:hypothetical protein OQA88_5571 [Cercophora sp. LCS_1]
MVFHGESELMLLGAGIDPDMVKDMLDDFAHENWGLQQVEVRVKEFWNMWYEDAKETGKDIGERVAAFDDDLSPLEEYARRGTLSEAAYRIRTTQENEDPDSSGYLTHQETKYLEDRDAGRAESEVEVLIIICRIFLQGLVLPQLEPCPFHSRGQTIDSDVTDDCVNFRMVLEYGLGGTKQRSMLFLRVKSEETSSLGAGLPWRFCLSSLSPASQQSRPRKARKLKAQDAPGQASRDADLAHEPADSQAAQGLVHDHNLCKAEDVCKHVSEHAKALHQSRREGCVGYVISDADNLTHHLIAPQDRESKLLQTCLNPQKSLAAIIQSSKKVDIAFPEQLRLALRLSQSLLHYHSTAWWRQNWSLDDIWYFDVDEDLSKSLATLHIDKELTSKRGEPRAVEC